MRYFIIIIIGVIICVLSQIYSSAWWIFAPVVFLLSLTVRFISGWKSFFAGMLIVFITWITLYLYFDMLNNSIISRKMATVFSIPNNYLLFFVASLVMGIIGGMASAAAYFLRKK